jgi:PAS domain S-box-containing protein
MNEPSGQYQELLKEIALLRQRVRELEEQQAGLKILEEDALNNANRVQRQNNAIMQLAVDETIATGDISRIFSMLTKTAAGAIEVDRASIWLLSEDGEILRCADLYEAGAMTHSQGAILKQADYPNYFTAIRNSRRIVAGDVRQDPRTIEFRDGYLVPLGIVSMLDVGIYPAGRLTGVVCFEHRRNKRIWHADEEAFANAVAAMAAQTLVNMERKRAEEAMLSEQLFTKALLDSLPGIFYLYTYPELRLVRWNKNHETLLGYSPGEINNRHIMDWQIPEAKEAVRLAIEAGMEKGFNMIESPLLTKDGKPVPFLMTGIRFDIMGKSYLMGVGIDITERKRTEEALRQSEARLAEAQAIAHMGNWEYDIGAQSATLSDELFRIFGFDPAFPAPPLADFFNVVHPDDRERVIRKRDRNVAARKSFTDEYRIVQPDGSVRWVEIHSNPQFDDNGNLVKDIGTAQDITERKLAEEALADEITRRRILVEQSRDGIVVLDWDGRAVETNKCFARMLGYSREEVLQLHVWDWDESFPRERLLEMVRIVDEKGDHFETRHRRKDGALIDVEISSNGAVFGRQKRVFCVCRDITERKLAELALREAENRYRLLFDQSPDGIIIIDPETGRFLDFNEAACGQLGYSREEFAGLTLADFLVDEKPEDIRRRQEKILREERDDFESRSRTRKGEIKNFHVTTRGTEISGRKVFHSVIHDITEGRKLQEQLRQSQKLEGMGQLAGGIAHDFNNVLSAVMGLTEMIIMDMAEDDPARHNAEEILKAVNKGADLTRQILAFSRQQALEMKPVNINDAIRDLQKMLRRLVREDITINLRLSDAELTVMADRAQIDQVLMNLSTNASAAMPDGGNIDISTGVFVMDERFVATHGFGSPGSYAHIAFSDTGCGMDAKTLDNIFDPFFTTKEKGKGTGLGLAVAHGILKQHNGHVNVYSEPGKGTVFNIYLPLTSEQALKTAAPLREKPRGGTETILIAEDDNTVRDIINTMLTGFGYKVIEAVDGEDAIRKFAENSEAVRLALLDGIMPKKNGEEAFEAIKGIRPDIRAIFLSGYTDSSFDHDKLIRMGATFLQKPVKPTELLRKVREILDAP